MTEVVATYLKPNGDPAQGRVEFRLVAATYHDGLDAIFPTVGVTGVLDNTGGLSVELEPTSGVDAGFDATDMTYQVTERVTGARRDVYYVDIPSTPGVDLGALTTYDSPPGSVREFVVPDLSTIGYATSAQLTAAASTAAAALAASDAANVIAYVRNDAVRYSPAPSGDTTGVTDTAALQTFLTALGTTGTGRLRAGTFYITGSGDPILTILGGIHLDGPRATVKLKDSNGAYNAMIGAVDTNVDVTGLKIRNITWDGNSANNPVVAGDITANVLQAGKHRKWLTGIGTGTGVRIEDNTFKNFNGTWVMSASCVSAGSLGDVKYRRNRHQNIGGGDVTLMRDHSSVYLDAVGFEISHNVFQAPATPTAASVVNYGARTAIEGHGGGQKVHHNEIIGYQFVGNLTASTVAGDTSASWHHNYGKNIGVGIDIVTYSSMTLNDVNIHDNHFVVDWLTWHSSITSAPGTAGIRMNQSGTEAVHRLNIHDNTIEYVEATHAGVSYTGPPCNGITLGRTGGGAAAVERDWKVTGNTIKGAPDGGIYILAGNLDGLMVKDNTIRDCNSRASSASYAIMATAANYLKNAQVSGNLAVDDQTGSYSPYGNTVKTLSNVVLMLNADASSVNNQCFDNSYSLADATAINPVSGSTSAVAGSPLSRIRMKERFSPGGHHLKGSTAYASADGLTYVQTTLPAGNTWA